MDTLLAMLGLVAYCKIAQTSAARERRRMRARHAEEAALIEEAETLVRRIQAQQAARQSPGLVRLRQCEEALHAQQSPQAQR